MRLRTMIAILFVAGGLAAGFVAGRNWLFKPRETPSVELKEVAVAKRDIPKGTVLDEDSFDSFVTKAQYPVGDYYLTKAIVNLDELKGKRAHFSLRQGDYILVGDFGLEFDIAVPQGTSKYKIELELKFRGGMLRAGDVVGIVETETLPNGKTKSKFVFGRVLVLHAQFDDRVESVTLAVTDVQRTILDSIKERNGIKLVLDYVHGRGAVETIPIEE
jgi:hypothetical protein